VPELPEVETVVRDLRPRLAGCRILRVTHTRHALRRPWQPRWGRVLPGQRFGEVRRRGKWIVAALDSDLHLVFHLGMTGQLVVCPAAAPRLDHTHLVFRLSPADLELRFRDIRRFGSATLFSSAVEVARFFEDAGLGPEPFALEAGAWRQRLGTTQRVLKAILLDQRAVAGVGNIYADESLFAARLHPARIGNELKADEANRLRRAIVAVLTRAIDGRGTSIRDYVGGSGLQGQFQEQLAVYGRTGAPCLRCRTAIQAIRLAGRSTHFCPRCQRLP
jgi:formamidopyrimidine-DNA glycosylase